MDGAFSAHGPARDGAFYLTALTDGHSLWRQGLPVRALSLSADLSAQANPISRLPCARRIIRKNCERR